MEIERKYLIHTLPENLENYPHRIIEQGYLSTEPVVDVYKRQGTSWAKRPTSTTSFEMPQYSKNTIAANTPTTIRAEPNFFFIFNLVSNQHTGRYAKSAISQPITNGRKKLKSFTPATITMLVAIRLAARLTATFQYGRLFSTLLHLCFV